MGGLYRTLLLGTSASYASQRLWCQPLHAVEEQRLYEQKGQPDTAAGSSALNATISHPVTSRSVLQSLSDEGIPAYRSGITRITQRIPCSRVKWWRLVPWVDIRHQVEKDEKRKRRTLKQKKREGFYSTIYSILPAPLDVCGCIGRSVASFMQFPAACVFWSRLSSH